MGTDKKIRSKEEVAADEELEDLFSDIEGTVQVKLTRLEPEYAEGYCGKFNVTSGRPLTSHEIKTRFGGKVFQMTARDSGGKYLKRKIISISGLPKDEGRIINPDGSLQPIGDNEQQSAPKQSYGGNVEALALLANLPISAQAKQLLTQEVLGIQPTQEKNGQSQSVIDMMNMQAMMRFEQEMKESKQREREAQLRYEKTMAEMRRDEEQWRRDMQQHEKPKDTLSGMNDLVKVFREMNGLKEEIGSSGAESIPVTLISNTMPIIETMMAEFMQLKKTQIQMEIARAGASSNVAPPELPARQTATASPLRVVDEEPEGDPIAMARKMGALFSQLSPDVRQKAMEAFFQGDQNVESNPYNDTIDDDEDDSDMMIDDEDRAIMDASQNQQNENGNVQNGEHTRSTDDNDPNDSHGNQSGRVVSAD
jgi:hypothetical protein